MDTKTPFVSDEQIRSVPMHDIDTGELVALEEMSPYRVRDLYEAELQSMRERLSRMEEAGNAVRIAAAGRTKC